MYDEAGYLLGEYTATGTLIQETIWLGDIPVATLRPKAGGGVDMFYVHTDHLSAPRKVTRASDGVLMWRWDPAPFGDTRPNENPQNAGTFRYNLRFPGQYFDAESGLNYNYARDYDPYTGRYLESDPIGLDGGINAYAYAGGNAVSFYDPYGLEALPDTVPRTNPAPPPRAPVLPFPTRPPAPRVFPIPGAGVVAGCLGIIALGVAPADVSQCQDAYPPEGVNCPDDDDRCTKALTDARRVYNELTLRAIPQYMYNSRIGEADAGHHQAIQEGQARLRSVLNRIRRFCKVLPPDMEKMERLANQDFPVRH